MRQNLIASYLAQGFVALLGIGMLPIYLQYLGTEAYGLVGFFAMLQAWFQLLDMGLTPTLSREMSRVRAGTLNAGQAATMVRALEWLLGLLGLFCALAVALSAGWIARDWLKARSISEGDLVASIELMGAMIAMRWLVGLYRGGLSGLEQMVALNAAGGALAVLRALGSWLVLGLWTTRPVGFFVWNLFVGLIELLVIGGLFYRAFPMRGVRIYPNWSSLQGIVGLAGGMAFLSGLWVVISQADKLVLSRVLDLHDYGCFMITVVLAGGISQLALPMTQSLQPRFAVLAAQGAHDTLTNVYRGSTQVACAVLFSIAAMMACFAGPLLLAWTGNAATSLQAARTLPLYATGNAVAVLLGLAFSVQFAYGRIRWHIIGNCLFVVLWIPGVWLASHEGGAVGVGWVWLGGNLVYLILWLPHVQRFILPSLSWRWLVRDVGQPALAVAIVVFGLRWIGLPETGRVGIIVGIGCYALVAALVGLAASCGGRKLLSGLVVLLRVVWHNGRRN